MAIFDIISPLDLWLCNRCIIQLYVTFQSEMKLLLLNIPDKFHKTLHNNNKMARVLLIGKQLASNSTNFIISGIIQRENQVYIVCHSKLWRVRWKLCSACDNRVYQPCSIFERATGNQIKHQNKNSTLLLCMTLW